MLFFWVALDLQLPIATPYFFTIMSYLVLARKWRPQNFEDVIGQEPVVRTLKNALKKDRVAHAMIFSGVRGVGKTTLARIMAKALNCQTPDIEPPCNTCDSCHDITSGNAIDLHEIDGASNRGIQEIRELKENIRFFPVRGRYKIIIIDEVHMLTTEAFNALLKTLEEPPEHVFFMFATTELHKVPITILSRCQRYELKRIPSSQLVAFLKKIAQAEQVDISDRAIEMIVREAEGSVRDGLSLLDQIFSFGGDQVTDEDVIQVLGLVDSQVIEQQAKALLSGDPAKSLEILDRSFTAGLDLKRFTNDLLSYFRALLICKSGAKSEELLDLSDREFAVLREIASDHSFETLYQYFHLLVKGIENMQYSAHPRMVLEMAFINAIQAGDVVPVTELLKKLDPLLQGVGEIPAFTLKDPGRSFVEEKVPSAAVDQEQTKKKSPVDPPGPTPVASDHTRRSETKDKGDPAAKVEIEAPRKKVRENWDGFIEYVKDRKAWMAHVLRMVASAREEDSDLVLKYENPSDCKVLQEQENLKLLTEFAQDFFQKELSVKFKMRGANPDAASGVEGDGPQEERRALANDPLVRMTAEVFDGHVVGIRTGPRSR